MSLLSSLLTSWPGVLGLLLVTAGVLYHARGERGLPKEVRWRNGLFFFGGLLLLYYSVLLHDPIFVVLQIIFAAAAAWEIMQTYRRR